MAIDLQPIKSRIIQREHWSEERTDAAIGLYRHFLILALKNRDQLLAPSEEIDVVWHYHLLDTRRYSRDCKKALGFFLHHVPDDQNTNDGNDAVTKTKRLFESNFGVSLATSVSVCSGGDCRTGCRAGGNDYVSHGRGGA